MRSSGPVAAFHARVRNAAVALVALAGGSAAAELEIAGVAVVPHSPTVATELRYVQPRGPTDGARVQVFLRNAAPREAMLAADAAITVGG